MRIIIDDKICKEKGMELPSVLAILLVKTGVNISELFDKLVKEEVFVKDLFSSSFMVTQRWDEVCSDILLSAENNMPNEVDLDNLAESMMEIFPKGKKEGTNNYWRGNIKDTKLKLKKFFKLYGNNYSPSQILVATKKYVETHNGNYSYMRVLKYFIWKDVRKTNSEGVGYIEEVSDLATFLENAGQEENLSNDWTSQLR